MGKITWNKSRTAEHKQADFNIVVDWLQQVILANSIMYFQLESFSDTSTEINIIAHQNSLRSRCNVTTGENSLRS